MDSDEDFHLHSYTRQSQWEAVETQSDESNSMKWKILHCCIHLGGLSQQTSNQLIIQRALRRRSTGQARGGYADSMIEWCMEMGLTLYKHIAAEDTYPLLSLNKFLKQQDPESDIHIHTPMVRTTRRKRPP